jgi:hypothetical protein
MIADTCVVRPRQPRLALALIRSVSAAESACSSHNREDLRERRFLRECFADAEQVCGGAACLARAWWMVDRRRFVTASAMPPAAATAATLMTAAAVDHLMDLSVPGHRAPASALSVNSLVSGGVGCSHFVAD